MDLSLASANANTLSTLKVAQCSGKNKYIRPPYQDTAISSKCNDLIIEVLLLIFAHRCTFAPMKRVCNKTGLLSQPGGTGEFTLVPAAFPVPTLS